MIDLPGGEMPLGPVDLAVPASYRYLRVLRLVSASMAATIGLDDDQMDDVRIAVDELGGMLVTEAPRRAELRVTLCGVHGHLIADGGLVGADWPGLLDPVSELVLDGLDIDWDIHPRRASFRLVVPTRAHGRGGS